MPIPKGTVSIMLNTQKNSSAFNLKTKEKISKNAQFKLKWKTIQWLVRHKKEGVKNIRNKGKVIFCNFCLGNKNVFFFYIIFFRILLIENNLVKL